MIGFDPKDTAALLWYRRVIQSRDNSPAKSGELHNFKGLEAAWLGGRDRTSDAKGANPLKKSDVHEQLLRMCYTVVRQGARCVSSKLRTRLQLASRLRWSYRTLCYTSRTLR